MRLTARPRAAAAMPDGRYGATGDLQGIHVYRAVMDRGVRRYEDL